MEYKHPNGYECLAKENFWDKIKADYPGEFEHFSKWIDEYKRKVHWDDLFHDQGDSENPIPKYHDLPIAMQFGIFYEYLCGILPKTVTLTVILPHENIAHNIKNHFIFIHRHGLIKTSQHDQ